MILCPRADGPHPLQRATVIIELIHDASITRLFPDHALPNLECADSGVEHGCLGGRSAFKTLKEYWMRVMFSLNVTTPSCRYISRN